MGGGEKCRDLLPFLEEQNIIPYCICDSDPEKWGRKFYGYDILPIESVREIDFFLIVSVAINNYEEIVSKIDNDIIVFHMCMPFRVDKTFLSIHEVINKESAYQEVYDQLEDKTSKFLFIKLLNYKMTGDATNLLTEIDGNTFFDGDIIPHNNSHVFIDCGAYTGDTLMRFYAFVGGDGKYKKMIAVEADDKNCKCIEELITFGRVDNVEIINKGCWSRKDRKFFYGYDEGGFENGDLNPDSKDDLASINRVRLQKQKKIEKSINVDSVDNMMSENACIPSIIKICTVSSDYETLIGCKSVCQQYKPIIIVELGTRPSDLLNVPTLLKEYNAGYKFYLRQKRIFGDSKTVLYAV